MTTFNKITNKEGSVFVACYGSLRRGMHNFSVNARGNGTYFGTGETKNNYNLYRYGGAYFPSVSLAHDSHGVPVVVDIFEVPVTGLTGAYDSLEGYRGPDCDNFYNRSKIDIVMDDGRELEAYVYHIDEEQEEAVLSGDWCAYNVEDYYKKIKESEA